MNTPQSDAFDLARQHMRMSLAARRRGEFVAAEFFSRTAASFAARAKALAVAP